MKYGGKVSKPAKTNSQVDLYRAPANVRDDGAAPSTSLNPPPSVSYSTPLSHNLYQGPSRHNESNNLQKLKDKLAILKFELEEKRQVELPAKFV